MTERTQRQAREICRRVGLRRQRKARRVTAGFGAASVGLTAGAAALLGQVQQPGLADVTAGYGSVLLHQGAGAYVLVGLGAFVVGVIVSVVCIRLHGKHTPERGTKDPP